VFEELRDVSPGPSQLNFGSPGTFQRSQSSDRHEAPALARRAAGDRGWLLWWRWRRSVQGHCFVYRLRRASGHQPSFLISGLARSFVCDPTCRLDPGRVSRRSTASFLSSHRWVPPAAWDDFEPMLGDEEWVTSNFSQLNRSRRALAHTAGSPRQTWSGWS
jgi:hypothetical protein